MNDVIALRHSLHAHPELSGDEVATSRRVRDFFAALAPDDVYDNLGGSGIAFGFGDAGSGPTVMLRCELDALPIQERLALPYRSVHDGCSHKCGHDGHMAILAAVGVHLSKYRPVHGRVVLLYQPAEETGAGAAAVIRDPAFANIRPDRVFGLHNIPGCDAGQIIIRDGTFACASRGMRIVLTGRTAHAAHPETGASPAAATAEILSKVVAPPPRLAGADELMLTTVVGVDMGGANFGVVPDRAEIFVTLRAETDQTMARLVAHCEKLARTAAQRDALTVEFNYEEIFDATINAPQAVDTIRAACRDMNIVEAPQPFRWSEDFGQFTAQVTGAFFGLGSGTDLPDLHHDDYDFPDELIEVGARAFVGIVEHSLAEAAA